MEGTVSAAAALLLLAARAPVRGELLWCTHDDRLDVFVSDASSHSANQYGYHEFHKIKED